MNNKLEIPDQIPHGHQSQTDKLNPPNKQQDNKDSASSSSQSIDYYDDQPFDIQPTKFDLKALWLGDTDDVLQKFETKLTEFKDQQKYLIEGFKRFAENQQNYRLSSIRQIKIEIDPKVLYSEYLCKTRQAIEKLDPTLLINIMSYVDANLFLTLTKMRKISKIFNQFYCSQQFQYFLAERDFLCQHLTGQTLTKQLIRMCKGYLLFTKTFIHYKNIYYTEEIPQNSITKDIQESVEFINAIHKLAYIKRNRDFTYYHMMNIFMKKHRVVIGLSSLSLTSLVLIRKAAIIAFANYLAFNAPERSRDQITKTKYSKVIEVVEHEDYRDALIINTKVSNYLWKSHAIDFAVIVTPYPLQNPTQLDTHLWDILIFHHRDSQRTVFFQQISLEIHTNYQQKSVQSFITYQFQSNDINLQFYEQMNRCKMSMINFMKSKLTENKGNKFETIVRKKEGDRFGFCYVYRLEDFYVIIMPYQE